MIAGHELPPPHFRNVELLSHPARKEWTQFRAGRVTGHLGPADQVYGLALNPVNAMTRLANPRLEFLYSPSRIALLHGRVPV